MSITGIGEIANLAGSIVDRIWPDKTQTEKDQAALQIQQMLQDSQERLAQVEVDKAEASTGKFFIAGARPTLIWVGAVMAASKYILIPWYLIIMHSFGKMVEVPDVAFLEYSPILLGMLGLRTYEKKTGVNDKHG